MTTESSRTSDSEAPPSRTDDRGFGYAVQNPSTRENSSDENSGYDASSDSIEHTCAVEPDVIVEDRTLSEPGGSGTSSKKTASDRRAPRVNDETRSAGHSPAHRSQRRSPSPAGKLSITFSVPREEFDDRMQMSFDLQNPDFVIDRMLERLANRFPPETVVTIAPMGAGLDLSPRGSDARSTVYDRKLSRAMVPGVPVGHLPYVVLGDEVVSAITEPALASVGGAYRGVRKVQPHTPSTGVVVTSVAVGDMKHPGILTADGRVIIGKERIVLDSGEPAIVTAEDQTIAGVKHVSISAHRGAMPAIILLSGQVARGERHVVTPDLLPAVETADGRVIAGERHAFVTDEGFIVTPATSTAELNHHSALLIADGSTIIGERHFFTAAGNAAISIGSRIIEGAQHTTIASVPGALPAIVLDDGRIILGKCHGVNGAGKAVVVTASSREVEGVRHVFVDIQQIAAGLMVLVPCVIGKDDTIVAGVRAVTGSSGAPAVVHGDGSITEGISLTSIQTRTGAIPAVRMANDDITHGQRHIVTEAGLPGVVSDEGEIFTGISHLFISERPEETGGFSVSEDGLPTHFGLEGVYTVEGRVIVGDVEKTDSGAAVRLPDGRKVPGRYVTFAVPVEAKPVVISASGEVTEGTVHVVDHRGRPAVLTHSGKMVVGERHAFRDADGNLTTPMTTSDTPAIQGFGEAAIGICTPEGKVILGESVIAAEYGEKGVQLSDGRFVPGLPISVPLSPYSVPCVVTSDETVVEGIKHVVDHKGRPAVITEDGRMVHGVRHGFKDPSGTVARPIRMRAEAPSPYATAQEAIVTPDGRLICGDVIPTAEGAAIQLPDGSLISGKAVSLKASPVSIPCVVTEFGEVAEGIEHVIDAHGRPGVLVSDGRIVVGERHAFKNAQGEMSEAFTDAASPKLAGVAQTEAAVSTADGKVIIGENVGFDGTGARIIKTPDGKTFVGEPLLIPVTKDSVPAVTTATGEVVEGVQHVVDAKGSPAVLTASGDIVPGVRHTFKSPEGSASVPMRERPKTVFVAEKGVVTPEGDIVMGNLVRTPSGTAAVQTPEGLLITGRPITAITPVLSVPCVVSSTGEVTEGIEHIVDEKGKPAVLTADGKVVSGTSHAFKDTSGNLITPREETSEAVVTADGRVIIGEVIQSPTGEDAIVTSPDGRTFFGTAVTLQQPTGSVPAVVTSSGKVVVGVEHVLDPKGKPAVRTASGQIVPGVRHTYTTDDGFVAAPLYLRRSSAQAEPSAQRGILAADGRVIAGEVMSTPTGFGVKSWDGKIVLGNPITYPVTSTSKPCIISESGEVIPGVRHIMDGGKPAILSLGGKVVHGMKHGFVDPKGNLVQPLLDTSDEVSIPSDMARGVDAVITPEGRVFIGQALPAVSGDPEIQTLQLPDGRTVSGRPATVPVTAGAVPSVVTSTGEIIEGVEHTVNSRGKPAVVTKDGKTITGERQVFKNPDGRIAKPIARMQLPSARPVMGLLPMREGVAGIYTASGRILVSDSIQVEDADVATLLLPSGETVRGTPVTFSVSTSAAPMLILADGKTVVGTHHSVDGSGRPCLTLPDGSTIPGERHGFISDDGSVSKPLTEAREVPDGLMPTVRGIVTSDFRIFLGDSVEQTSVDEMSLTLPGGMKIKGSLVLIPKDSGAIPCVLTMSGDVVTGGKHVIDPKGRPCVMTSRGHAVPGERQVFKQPDGSIAVPFVMRPPKMPVEVPASPFARLIPCPAKFMHGATAATAMTTMSVGRSAVSTGFVDTSFRASSSLITSSSVATVTAVLTSSFLVAGGETASTTDGHVSMLLPDGRRFTGIAITINVPQDAVPCVVFSNGESLGGVRHALTTDNRPAVIIQDGREIAGERYAFKCRDNSLIFFQSSTTVTTTSQTSSVLLPKTTEHREHREYHSSVLFPKTTEHREHREYHSSVLLPKTTEHREHREYAISGQAVGTSRIISETLMAQSNELAGQVGSSRVISETLMGAAPDEERVKIVEVPFVQEVIKHVPKIEKVYREKRVPKTTVQYVEKIVEVPNIQYIDNVVEVPEVHEVVRHVPVKQVCDVPKEIITYVPKIETKIVEKRVEVPGEVIDVPKPYPVEQKVVVPHLKIEEVPTVVAQCVVPSIEESSEVMEMQVRTLEPKLVAVDVYVPVPVELPALIGQKVSEELRTVSVPPTQWNSLVRHLNPGQNENIALAVSFSGGIPMLPSDERILIVPPHHSGWTSTYQAGKFYCDESSARIDIERLTAGVERQNISYTNFEGKVVSTAFSSATRSHKSSRRQVESSHHVVGSTVYGHHESSPHVVGSHVVGSHVIGSHVVGSHISGSNTRHGQQSLLSLPVKSVTAKQSSHRDSNRESKKSSRKEKKHAAQMAKA